MRSYQGGDIDRCTALECPNSTVAKRGTLNSCTAFVLELKSQAET
jgi:hypothetical protein